MRYKILTDREIKEARELKGQGLSNRRIAEKFEVGKTTIWDNVYRTKPPPKRTKERRIIYSFRKLQGVIKVVIYMRREYNSLEIAQKLDIPLAEVNYIFSHFNE